MVNPERGEVEFKIDDEIFVLCAEMDRIVAWGHKCGVKGPEALQEALMASEFDVITAGVRCLCVSENVDKLSQMFRFVHLGAAQNAILSAMLHGVDTENPPPAREREEKKTSPGETG